MLLVFMAALAKVYFKQASIALAAANVRLAVLLAS